MIVNSMVRTKIGKAEGSCPNAMGMGPTKITAPPETCPTPENKAATIMNIIPMKIVMKPIKKNRGSQLD